MEQRMISLVIPVFNEEQVIRRCYVRTKAALESISCEFIFVDDGSIDTSRFILQDLADTDPAVKVVLLSRNFGHQNAVSAGLAYAKGDAVVVMDADLQDPPELIPQFVKLWQEDGYDVVYGIRQTRRGDPWVKKATARWFYRMLHHLSDVDLPLDAGDFRLLSRRVVDILTTMPEYHRYLRGMATWAGFRQTGVPYHREPRQDGATHYTWKRMWHLSLDGITSFSVKPLQWIRRIALGVAAIALVVSLWLIYQKVTNPHNHALVLGWTSMMVTILWLGALQIGVLGIIGEYVGRIMEQVRQRPSFIVDQVVDGADEATQVTAKVTGINRSGVR